ncbi:twitching motility protein PilT [Fibrobacterales bacterium]|nr:twitching motility protein PilT [Fibrobacterales bacterium]
MKKVLVDINVILDCLNQRNNFETAAEIINLCEEKEAIGFVGAHEITTLSYFLNKSDKDTARVKTTLLTILDIFSVIPIAGNVLREALLSPINDYEDAVLEVSALAEKLDFIITRNLSDFTDSRVSALTPEEFLDMRRTITT